MGRKGSWPYPSLMGTSSGLPWRRTEPSWTLSRGASRVPPWKSGPSSTTGARRARNWRGSSQRPTSRPFSPQCRRLRGRRTSRQPWTATSQHHGGRAGSSRRSTTPAFQAVGVEAAAASGKSMKTWRTVGDKRVRPSHRALEGVTVSIDAVFWNGLSYPSGPNCRCSLEFSGDGPGRDLRLW